MTNLGGLHRTHRVTSLAVALGVERGALWPPPGCSPKLCAFPATRGTLALVAAVLGRRPGLDHSTVLLLLAPSGPVPEGKALLWVCAPAVPEAGLWFLCPDTSLR